MKFKPITILICIAEYCYTAQECDARMFNINSKSPVHKIKNAA